MINSPNDRWEYNGDGVSTVFAYDNTIFAAENLLVYVDGLGPLILNTDYTVSGAPDYLAGNVTFAAAPGVGVKNVVIERNVQALQATAFPVGNSFPSAAVERAFDRLTVLVQQLGTKTARMLQLSPIFAGVVSLLVTPAAGKLIGWNVTGDALENKDAAELGAVVNASTAVAGIVYLADHGEATAGLDDTKAMTPKDTALAIATLANVIENPIINADWQVDQMNGGAGSAGAADMAQAADCWRVLSQTANIEWRPGRSTADGKAEAGAADYMYLKQIQAAAQRLGAVQMVHSKVAQDYKGATVNAAMRVNMSVAGTVRLALLEWTGTADSLAADPINNWASNNYTVGNFFAAANLDPVHVIGSVAVNANTWTDLIVTGTLGTNFNNLLLVAWSDAALAQNAILRGYLARFHEAVGALPILRETFATALRRCRRFLRKSFSYAQAPATGIGSGTGEATFTQASAAAAFQGGNPIRFDDPMEKTPTITLYNTDINNAQARAQSPGVDCSGTTASGITPGSLYLGFTNGAGTAAGQRIGVHWLADARM